MNTEEYIEFNRKLGHKVIVTDNCAWIFYDGYAHAFPQLESTNPDLSDFKQVFRHNIITLLFRTNASFTNTYEYVFIGDNYDLSAFSSKIRNQIRKGLKSCIVKDADFESLSKNGFEINVATLKRHDRAVPNLDNRDKWEPYISTFLNQRDVSVKGAYVDDNLVAYIIFLKVNGKYIIYHPFMDYKFSSSNPMNAILFSFISGVISREGKIEVSYGLASFAEKSSLDKFKKGMLFTEKPATRIAVIRKPVNWFLNGTTQRCLSRLTKTGIISMDVMEKINYLIESKKDYNQYIKGTRNL